MRGTWTGAGLSIGAGLGLLFGLLISASWWGPLVGVTGGLVIGAIIEAQASRRHPDS